MGDESGEVSELFAKWAGQEGLLAQATEEQVAKLARAFIAGFVYGQNPILRDKALTFAEDVPGVPL